MMTLWDWLDKRKELREEQVVIETTLLTFGLATSADRNRLKQIKKELEECSREIQDRTK